MNAGLASQPLRRKSVSNHSKNEQAKMEYFAQEHTTSCSATAAVQEGFAADSCPAYLQLDTEVLCSRLWEEFPEAFGLLR